MFNAQEQSIHSTMQAGASIQAGLLNASDMDEGVPSTTTQLFYPLAVDCGEKGTAKLKLTVFYG